MDATLPNALSAVTVSNHAGVACLVVTSATLIATNITIGSGGCLQIDDGGVLTNGGSFAWRGIDGVIRLNKGGQIRSSATLSFLFPASGVTGTITSASGPGHGGVWNADGKNFNWASGGSDRGQWVVQQHGQSAG
jgi:hypothetical protein